MRLRRWALTVDSWIDTSLYSAGARLAQGWRSYSDFADRFAARGAPRVAADLACEGLTLSVAAGVVMLALAIPAFNETRGEAWLKQPDLAVTFLDRYGEEIGRRGVRQDDSLKLDDYPDYFLQAVLATEDRRFFQHLGVDPIGTSRALFVNARASGVVQGGSTITQQLAKNLFLSNERSIERKIKEAFLSLFLEARLTKSQILKLYLDRVYMGGGNFGAAAAAEFYFGKSARDLTLAEAAMLAGLFKAPTKFAPHINLPAARGRAADVLSNMVEAGFLTDGQVASARRNPAVPLDRKRDFSPDYFLDWAFDEVRRMTDENKLGNDRVLTVKTTLDVGIEKSAETAIENALRQYGEQWGASQAGTVIMEPDGAVRAMVGGRDYGASQFNRATDALRQPGSSFKPYVYTAALLSGKFKPSSIVVDAPVCIGNWCPANYGHSFAGAVTLTSALVRSINTIPVRLSKDLGRGDSRIGRAKIIEVAHRMGIVHELKLGNTSLPIGSAEVNILEHTSGFAVFANGGKRATPYGAFEIRNSRGDVIWRHDRNAPKPEQVIPLKIIEDMNGMLNKVVEEGTGRRARIDGVKVGGKTGTTNAYRDAWFVGFTGNYVAAVWMGNDDYSSTDRMTGGTLPAQAWHDMMEPIHRGIDIKPLPGVEPFPAATTPVAAGAPAGLDGAVKAGALSRRSYEAVDRIGELFKSVEAGHGSVGSADKPDSGTTGSISPTELSAASRQQAAPTTAVP
ncbi:transglycosylase domain-containing protein [Chelatococcus reniformis]|uniref:Penicillin-binding protein 1A n=1 Tax=Chelatococcus reniformis TaxID=1494448 RepID=A0A916UHY4_9HYPH|nr:PBP1A family penicillin-binding protein [Chelatococcus reniformis]GGC73688.1 penicillin-binding protein 1A [Chelatococcus reniformis]